ncbi:NAD(P)/FAD-dependent oxidoreductase [Fuerstiella marisgermanici]|uniref:Putative FAD-binding dehydrogenase n=1 Tax=Fuerstiella marisgermanici TaxID=1891926 RepID=A0A1P8WMS9_9PLAN|nr:NAD(P)/FAD-dependent oxidoreductase [Fuerstiella marisgermanici]APZ95341.1 putative FAD-binding dehydrogenase [Fuerstiella marisgermanici]
MSTAGRIQDDQIHDVIIIGAGAAGLMAAGSAASRGKRVLLLEKNRKLGVKILMSGGTRCNITHNCDAKGIANAFGRQGKFLRSPLAALSPAEVIEKIEGQGVATKVESTGKIFPVSNKAIDVRDALVRLATEAGATILTEQPVVAANAIPAVSSSNGQPGTTEHSTSLFRVQTETHSFVASKLLITTGGRSYPGCGTTGDGYAWAEQFGHSIAPTIPALAPVVCHLDWVHGLKGITIEDVGLSIMPVAVEGSKSKRKPLDNGRGPLLFTHFGFSGPTVMNLSRIISRAAAGEPSELTNIVLRCDFLPSTSLEDLTAQFRQQSQSGGRQAASSLLLSFFPRRLAEALLEQASIEPTQRLAELSKQHTQRLVDAVKRTDFPIHGTLGYGKAEVTAGGVRLNEVDSRDMQSKRQPGLYLAGEVLDLDGPIGGFNFQAAFSTGWLAGQHV